ncbi:ATP synthase F1 subunit epsilon [Pontiellaceae bacterium B12219]|nr:ATP synthase F1 subunit epsilon [Pontiellaceae bacterium B12219]
MAAFHLHITTPEGNNWDGDVVSVRATGVEGSFGVMANHAPMIAGLQPGVITVRGESGTHFYAAGGGVLEVCIDKQVIILTDYAEPFETLEEAKVRVKELQHQL